MVDDIKFAKKYRIRVASVTGGAVATLVSVYHTKNKRFIFREGENDNDVRIQYRTSDDTIEIVGRGVDRAVAYTMKALLHHINIRKHYAPTGKVYIE